MLEFGLIFAVYAVSYLNVLVDPAYVEQKLSVEFRARQLPKAQSTPKVAVEEAALLYVDELQQKKERNLVQGRPCLKASRVYQPFYACIEDRNYEAELQIKTIEVPNPVPYGESDGNKEGDCEEQVPHKIKDHTLKKPLPVPRLQTPKFQNPPKAQASTELEDFRKFRTKLKTSTTPNTEAPAKTQASKTQNRDQSPPLLAVPPMAPRLTHEDTSGYFNQEFLNDLLFESLMHEDCDEAMSVGRLSGSTAFNNAAPA